MIKVSISVPGFIIDPIRSFIYNTNPVESDA